MNTFKSKGDAFPVKATNRKALRDYFIEDSFEAGIVLLGSEIKSIRDGRASLRDAYAVIENGEAFVYNMNISQYEKSSFFGHEQTRKRKLLLHKEEIKRLTGKIQEKGYTLVPVKLYIKNGKAKVEIGLARGKRKHDKRVAIASRDAEREMARELNLKGRFKE